MEFWKKIIVTAKSVALISPSGPIRIRIRGKGRKTELGKETERNMEPRIVLGILRSREYRKTAIIPLKMITIQKSTLRITIKSELKEALTIEVMTKNGKKISRIILVKRLIAGELSGSELSLRNNEPKAMRA